MADRSRFGLYSSHAAIGIAAPPKLATGSTMPKGIISETVGFPVYAVRWQDDATLIAAGGGGAGHSGVKNKIVALKLEQGSGDQAEVKVAAEYPLSADGDAPMTLAVLPNGTIATGINETSVAPSKRNKHLRIFELSREEPFNITENTQKNIINPSKTAEVDVYPHQIQFNSRRDPKFLAFALSTGDVAVVSYPTLEVVYKTTVDGGDIYGLHFPPTEDPDTVALITSKRIRLDSFQGEKSKKREEYPTLEASKSESGSLRSIRCAQFYDSDKLLSVQNDRQTKRAYFVWHYRPDADGPWSGTTPRVLPAKIKGVTSMDICIERRMIGVAASDMSVHVFNIDLQRLLSVPSVADFTLTQIAFNPKGSYLACGSVANTVAFIELDDSVGILFFPQLISFLDDYGGFIVFVLIILLAYLLIPWAKV